MNRVSNGTTPERPSSRLPRNSGRLLPIGDVSLAWAWPLDPGPGDTKIGVFHVNVGLLF